MTSGTRVYIGRISYDVRERDVEKFFKGYGRIREILLKDGFAFVEFDDQRDAEDAVYELNGKDLLGERVHVEFARGPTRGRGGRFGGGGGSGRFSSYGSSRGGGGSYGGGGSRNGSSSLSYSEKYGPPRNTEYRVIVENLSSRVSWQDLKDFMRQAGEVTYADAHKREKNMGIVDFASYSDMKAALEKLDGHDLHGRRLRLHEDKSRRRRSHSRSRSRPRRTSKSRSRSRSVSKSRSRSMSSGRSKSRSRSSSPPPRRSDRGDAGDHKDGTKSPASRSSHSRSRSRSKSPVNAASSNGGGRREAAGDAVKSSHRSLSRSRSRSGSARSRSVDKSGSRSRSRSPMSRDSRSPSVDRNHSDNSRHSADAD